MPSFPPEEIARVVRLAGLGAARTVPLAWFVPAFGGASVPAQLRLAFGLGLAVLCLPALGAQMPTAQTWWWFVLGLREAMVGVTMGFVCSCMFRAAEAAGQTIDILRGQSLGEVLSPTGENRTSPFGALYLLFAVVVFFEIGGLGVVATAPPGGLGEAIVHVADARGAAQVGVLGQALDEDLDRALGDQTMKFARDQDRPDAVRQGSPTLKIPLSERLVRRKDWSGGRGSWPNLWPHAKRRPAPSGNALKQLS